MKKSSARSRVVSSCVLSSIAHLPRRRKRFSAVNDEVECLAQVFDLRVFHQARIHVIDEISACQGEQLIAVRRDEPTLELIKRKVRQALVTGQLSPQRGYEDVLLSIPTVRADPWNGVSY